MKIPNEYRAIFLAVLLGASSSFSMEASVPIESSETACCVCYENQPTFIRCFQCKAVICEACVGKWVNEFFTYTTDYSDLDQGIHWPVKGKTCPICRTEITNEDIDRLLITQSLDRKLLTPTQELIEKAKKNNQSYEVSVFTELVGDGPYPAGIPVVKIDEVKFYLINLCIQAHEDMSLNFDGNAIFLCQSLFNGGVKIKANSLILLDDLEAKNIDLKVTEKFYKMAEVKCGNFTIEKSKIVIPNFSDHLKVKRTLQNALKVDGKQCKEYDKETLVNTILQLLLVDRKVFCG